MWSVGQTCQKLIEYVLRYVWVIEDSVRKPMIGEPKDNEIDLTTGDKQSKNLTRSPRFGSKISQLISSETVGKSIYHFAYTDDFRYHNDILKTIKLSSLQDRSKKVLLLRTRN